MTRVLVIQGAGMNMRGKSQVEIFGPDTLDQINEQIRGYAEGLGLDVEIVHSNIEGEVVNALFNRHAHPFESRRCNWMPWWRLRLHPGRSIHPFSRS